MTDAPQRAFAAPKPSDRSFPDWPVLTRYDAEHLARIALPLGGVGTGTVSLGGRGDLRDWEVVNRPAKGFCPRAFFALRVKSNEGQAITRCLEGPIDAALYEGADGSAAANHGLPRFQYASFEAAYPLGQVVLSDPDVPLQVRLQAFNPLIPADAKRSSYPVAVLRYVLTNTTNAPLAATVCGSLQNFIGNDGVNRLAKENRNRFRREARIAGLFMESAGVAPNAETAGTLALVALAEPDADVTFRTDWAARNWGGDLLDFWDDLHDDGRLENKESENGDTPTASLAVTANLAPSETRAVTFLLTWHFPNRQSWTPNGKGKWMGGGACDVGPPTIGNWYAEQFSDAWAVATRVAFDLPALEADTVAFVRAFCDSDLPAVVKEAALFNASTLRTQTVFRTPDGRLFGWEGCFDHHGSCFGSCTHVWNYETTTAFLFGDLSRSMREVEFLYATRPEDGKMRFRTPLPLDYAPQPSDEAIAAADGQMGCVMKLYRDWRLCGDDDWLRDLWPQAKKAMEFCWIPGGWDADRDGVMEGCQHNTMDVEYYGPNPQMGTWYLGALRACEEMALYLGEAAFADECRHLFTSGSRFMDDELFNGDYYEHKVVPPASEDAIAPGLRHPSMGARNLQDPELQLGAGCLIDQLVGQVMAHVCGLGYLLKPANVQATLQSILRYNGRESLWGHFNYMRTFALGNEAALLMASYPKGRRPARPFPYSSEVMTGFEHTVAAHLMYEGHETDGIKVIENIRNRYDGKKRSPFNEAECGHHYARAMAAWSSLLALTGFFYDGVEQTITFALPNNPVQWFWSTGAAWGVARLMPEKGSVTVELTIKGGLLPLRAVAVQGAGSARLKEPTHFGRNEVLTVVTVGDVIA